MNTGVSHQIVDTILQDLDFPKLYRSYAWKEDTWKRGFPDLFRLEQEISLAARKRSIKREHLIDIAKWGGLRNTKRISCPGSIRINLYNRGLPAAWLMKDPARAIDLLDIQVIGFGPTYSSKVLHFAVPQVFGALDTRLVRTFGKGDEPSRRYPLLNLKVTRVGPSWAINTNQPGWPEEFGTWTSALHQMAASLHENGIKCPHPRKFVKAGLREEGVWLPADVGTALFSYASKEIGKT